MPQYELMYILSSAVADSDEPALTDEIAAQITGLSGQILNIEKLGRKKLAFPIRKTRNGFYVLINFFLDGSKLHEVEHKIRVTSGIIRHLTLNKDESLIRQAKDREEQKMIRRPREGQELHKDTMSKPEMQIDLDRQIEKALEEDITK